MHAARRVSLPNDRQPAIGQLQAGFKFLLKQVLSPLANKPFNRVAANPAGGTVPAIL
jgi:hypothetical protein